MGGAARAVHSRSPVQVPEGTAASERAVVVSHNRWPCGVRVVVGTGQVLHLDFDPSVVGIASQPFWLHWTDEADKPASHAPDFFARRRDDLDRDRRAGPQLK